MRSIIKQILTEVKLDSRQMVEMLNRVEKNTGIQAFLIPLPVVQPPEMLKSLFCFYLFIIGNWQLFHGE